MRNPVVITSLAEDLRAIGLLREQNDQEEPAPESSAEGGYATEQEGDDEKSKSEQTNGDDKKDDEKTEQEKDDEKDEDVEQARDYIAALSQNFLKSHTPVTPGPVESRGKPSGKKPVTESKPKPKTESRSERIHRLAKGRLFESVAPKTPAVPAAPSGSARVAKLLQEVSDIVGGIHRAKRQEQIKGFANIAVVAEMLSRRFQTIAMDFSEGTLYRVSGEMQRLSEQASDMAVALDTPPEKKEQEPPEAPEPSEEVTAIEQDDAQVDMLFKKLMAKLLDALQLYNDVTGKEEQDDVPGDDEEPTEQGDMEPSPPATDDDEDDEDDEEPTTEQDDEEEPKAEQDETPYGEPAGASDEQSMAEAKKALRRVLKQGKLGKGKKKLMAGKRPPKKKK